MTAHRAPTSFRVRSKLVIRSRPGAYLVGMLVSDYAISIGMVAHIPGAPDGIHPISIRAIEFLDHRAEGTAELALHVVGETAEEIAALDALDGPRLVELTERA